MHLSANQHLFGYPALEIRRIMRAAADNPCAVEFVTATLGVQLDEAAELVETLLEEGLIALAENQHCDGPWYELTIKGRALAMASAAKPIRRSTAERLVSEFLQRVEGVNNDPNLVYWIDEVLVFGSFLTESETLGDVDLAVMYTRRTVDSKEWDALSRARVEQARASGRNFPLFIDELFWPQREVELRLRKRSGSLSLHDLRDERKFIEALPHRRIYLRGTGTATRGSDLTSESSCGAT